MGVVGKLVRSFTIRVGDLSWKTRQDRDEVAEAGIGQRSIEQQSETGKRTVGVDAGAHTGALDMGGHTVVVLGCGLDVGYPRRNVGLFGCVRAAGGTFLGEHPPGARPLAANFLPRNRLIAASLGEFGSRVPVRLRSCWSAAIANA